MTMKGFLNETVPSTQCRYKYIANNLKLFRLKNLEVVSTVSSNVPKICTRKASCITREKGSRISFCLCLIIKLTKCAKDSLALCEIADKKYPQIS